MFNMFKKLFDKPINMTEEERLALIPYRSCVKCKYCKFGSIFASYCKRYGLVVNSDYLCDRFEWDKNSLKGDLENVRLKKLYKQVTEEINFRKIEDNRPSPPYYKKESA